MIRDLGMIRSCDSNFARPDAIEDKFLQLDIPTSNHGAKSRNLFRYVVTCNINIQGTKTNLSLRNLLDVSSQSLLFLQCVGKGANDLEEEKRLRTDIQKISKAQVRLSQIGRAHV